MTLHDRASVLAAWVGNNDVRDMPPEALVAIFRTYLMAQEREAREAGLREAIAALENEKLSEPAVADDDVAYNLAIDHGLAAIRALLDAPPAAPGEPEQ